MEDNLSQTFEDSRQAVNDYLAYISRRDDRQQEKEDNLLNLVMENVDGVGTVAAMAAQESIVSHSTIFGMIKAMNTQQGLTAQMITELRQNGGVGGGGGGMLAGAGTMGTLGSIVGPLLEIEAANPIMLIPLAIGALIGAAEKSDQKAFRQTELAHPNSPTNKALDASAEAEKLINQIYYSLNPAPNPLTNGPGIVQSGVRRADLPFVQTPGEAFSVVAAINEANDYLEATGQIAPRSHALSELFSANYNDTEGIPQYNSELSIAAMQPQLVQVVTQPAANSSASEQTINFNIQNDFKGNWQDRRGLEDVGEYLAQQIKDRLNAGAPLRSYN